MRGRKCCQDAVVRNSRFRPWAEAKQSGRKRPFGRLAARQALAWRPPEFDRKRLIAYAVGDTHAEEFVKSTRKELWFNVPGRRAFVNITPQVEALLRESGIREGLCLVNAMHITASVFINDDEAGLHRDYDEWLEQIAPHEPISRYRHNRTGEDNGDAHLKRQVMGREVVVAVTAGRLDFGPWEQIFYGEFDGGRAKRVLVKIIGE
jgi:secondary thiamine-phosphate synthase enzyme